MWLAITVLVHGGDDKDNDNDDDGEWGGEG